VYGFLLVFFSNFVPKTHHFWDIRLQKCRDLENQVRGQLRSLEISPLDRAQTTSCWRSIVTMTISCRFWDIQCRKIPVTLKSGSKVTQGCWKWYISTPLGRSQRFPEPLTEFRGKVGREGLGKKEGDFEMKENGEGRGFRMEGSGERSWQGKGKMKG